LACAKDFRKFRQHTFQALLKFGCSVVLDRIRERGENVGRNGDGARSHQEGFYAAFHGAFLKRDSAELEYSERHRYRGRMRVLRSMLALCFLAISLVGLSGCAYSMGVGDRRLPEGYTLVSIPVFRNSTQEVGVEVPFTNAIIRELERSQIAKVVSKSDAQVVLEGNIQKIQYDVANQITCDAAPGQSCPIPIPQKTVLNTEYRITVETKLELRRVSDNRVLWSEQFTNQKSYLAPKIGIEGLNSANALYNHSARQENLSSMAVDLMAEAHGRLTENF